MAKQKQHIDPEKIHLKHIEEIFSDLDETEENWECSGSFDTNIAHNSAYNVSDNGFLLGLQVVFNALKTKRKHTCQFRYNFHFQVDNLEDMYTLNEEDIPVFKELFVATLAGISYSTLRGIIFEKTSDTPWGGLTLPVINPKLLLESWIENK